MAESSSALSSPDPSVSATRKKKPAGYHTGTAARRTARHRPSNTACGYEQIGRPPCSPRNAAECAYGSSAMLPLRTSRVRGTALRILADSLACSEPGGSPLAAGVRGLYAPSLLKELPWMRVLSVRTYSEKSTKPLPSRSNTRKRVLICAGKKSAVIR